MPDTCFATQKLRLFLSADLAGSTAFKQAHPALEWQQFFHQFYRQLPAYVERQKRRDDPAPLKFWKPVGDEIVFSAELSALKEVPACIAAFRRAVFAYRKEIPGPLRGLDIKCAGWTAGFPVGNLMVHLPDGTLDYIGPGMDIGFRLVKEASPRRMLISVELAYLLASSRASRGRPRPRIRLDCGLTLKGVGKGRTYPCFWLDNFSDDPSPGEADLMDLSEEGLRNVRSGQCEQGKVKTFCRLWLTTMGRPFVVPFIKGDAVVGTPPAGYSEMLREVEAQSQGPEGLAANPPRGGGKSTDASTILDDFPTKTRRPKAKR